MIPIILLQLLFAEKSGLADPNSKPPGRKSTLHTQQATPNKLSLQVIPRQQAYQPPAVAKMKLPTQFELIQEKGQLFIQFISNDHTLFLSRTQPFVIQLYTRQPLEVEPNIILESDWPKTGLKMPLKLTGLQPDSANRIEGKASYTYCSYSTQVCKSTVTPILYYAHP